MSKFLKTQLVISALVLSVTASNASAMMLNKLTDATSTAQVPVVKVHSLHLSCMRGSVTPSGTGQPVIWHHTKEVGVHTSCAPRTPPTGGKLQFVPRNGGGNKAKLKLKSS